MKVLQSAGLAIVCQGKVLLGHTTGRSWYGSYGIPKGGIEEGESHIEAARRETLEEVGLNVPLSLINKNEHTFTVNTRKHKFNKIVYYFIVEIDDLSQLGLKDFKIPKDQLQVKEIDWAGFMDYKEAMKRVMKSQITVISNLANKGLIT